MKRTLYANMLATHFNGLNTDRIIKSGLDSINDTLNERGELKLKFLKLFFNAQKTHLEKMPRHTMYDLRETIFRLNLLSNKQIKEGISSMEEDNKESIRPINFCNECKKEERALIPNGVCNILIPNKKTMVY
jgi:hypothetical protein